jgi:hypothetical protein
VIAFGMDFMDLIVQATAVASVITFFVLILVQMRFTRGKLENADSHLRGVPPVIRYGDGGTGGSDVGCGGDGDGGD